ncbi:response regulator transcription factor [Streptomyces sannanensis]|uniref:Response regulator transcription factor n=1 Tax=Streptomyces sannanensis TaxID=285536 RepID=A0ABP6S735_9ACTN
MTAPQTASVAQVRVLIVDDHPVVRRGLRALLDDVPEVVVAGEAGDGAEALRMVAGPTEVDVVLMDLRMGGGSDDVSGVATDATGSRRGVERMDGVEATRRIRALPAPPRVLVLTTYRTDAEILAAVEAGATGYLLKDAPVEELISAVHAVAAGETVLAPPVATRLLGRMRAPQSALTPRETEILVLLAKGLSNRQVSRALFISEATVKTHLVRVFAKLGVDSRTGAVTAALGRGLIPEPLPGPALPPVRPNPADPPNASAPPDRPEFPDPTAQRGSRA